MKNPRTATPPTGGMPALLKSWRENLYPGRGGSKHFAKVLGVSPQQWSQWENGVRTPNHHHLKLIADYFGITPKELLRLAQEGPAAFEPVAAPPSPPGSEQGMWELMRVMDMLTRMQMEVLSGARDGGKMTAALRDIVRYAKFVLHEMEETSTDPVDESKNME